MNIIDFIEEKLESIQKIQHIKLRQKLLRENISEHNYIVKLIFS
jgi:hypothetical protein